MRKLPNGWRKPNVKGGSGQLQIKLIIKPFPTKEDRIQQDYREASINKQLSKQIDGGIKIKITSQIDELKKSKNILKSLVIKNLVGNYKNSALGFMWHFVTPIMMLIVYFIAFTQVRTNPIPDFWIYIATAVFPFTFMTSNLTGGIGCIVSNSQLIKKMYFPREILVLSQIISSSIVMAIGVIIVIVTAIMSGYPITLTWLMLPIALILVIIFAMGYVFLLSALTVYSRDVQYFFNSITMLFFFITPMYFTPNSINGIFSFVVYINPFTYYVEFFHQITYYNCLPDLMYLFTCIFASALSLITGLFIFRKLKRGFVERL